MADDWTTVPASEVVVGDRIRLRGVEFVVAEIDPALVGRDGLLGLIEHTPDRWMKHPTGAAVEVEVRR
jgi:hypothetical protein